MRLSFALLLLPLACPHARATHPPTMAPITGATHAVTLKSSGLFPSHVVVHPGDGLVLTNQTPFAVSLLVDTVALSPDSWAQLDVNLPRLDTATVARADTATSYYWSTGTSDSLSYPIPSSYRILVVPTPPASRADTLTVSTID